MKQKSALEIFPVTPIFSPAKGYKGGVWGCAFFSLLLLFTRVLFLQPGGIERRIIAPLAQKNQAEERGQKPPPTMALITRTFAGDYARMKKWLLPTMEMFLLGTEIAPIFVFDDTPADHRIGEEIHARYGYTVFYEALPPHWQSFLTGRSFGCYHLSKAACQKKKKNIGYDRQLWSTFYFDQYTDADIIGVIDSDAMLFSIPTENTIFFNKRKIMLRGRRPNVFEEDKHILGFEINYDFMWGVDRLPVWYWRTTFVDTRRYIEKKYNTSFNKAYGIFSVGRFSPFNILAGLALKYDAHRYKLYAAGGAEAVVSVGCNRCKASAILLGCCFVYGEHVSKNCSAQKAAYTKVINHRDFLFTMNDLYLGFQNKEVVFARHQRAVQAYLKKLTKKRPHLRYFMERKCIDYLEKSHTPMPRDPIINTSLIA